MIKLERLGALLVTLLLVVTSFCVPLSATAEENEPYDDPTLPEEPYQIALMLTASLSISGSTANCSATLESRHGEMCSLTMRLQKMIDGQWSTIRSWYGSGPDIMLFKQATIGVGIYRVYASGYAGDEFVSIVSKIKVKTN